MPIYNDSDYNWHYSFGYTDLEQKSRGIFVNQQSGKIYKPNDSHIIYYTGRAPATKKYIEAGQN